MENYTGFKAYIEARLDRSDLTQYIDNFIRIAEAALNRELRCREMLITADITLSQGLGALPADYLQYRTLTPSSAPYTEIEYIAPSAANKEYPNGAAGTPCHFTINGGEIKVFPSSDEVLSLTYYRSLDGLSAENTTNWLLTSNPDIYMHAVLSEAYAFIGDTQKQMLSAQIAERFIEDQREADEMANYAKAQMVFEAH